MRRIAIYGKGGIGKSTTSSNVTDALAESVPAKKPLAVVQDGASFTR